MKFRAFVCLLVLVGVSCVGCASTGQQQKPAAPAEAPQAYQRGPLLPGADFIFQSPQDFINR
jgi:hypothetical protein